jgi:hypothetical protein
MPQSPAISKKELRTAAPTDSVAPASLTGVSWIPKADIGLETWIEQGKRLGCVGRSVGWWLGDWLIYGNQKFGEKYVRATRITGYDAQTLMNMAYVASRFPSSRRRSALSWSHHAELAALEVSEQERWLDMVEEQRMSVRSLRIEVRGARRSAQRSKPSQRDSGLDGAGALVPSKAGVECPNCRQMIELPALATE